MGGRKGGRRRALLDDPRRGEIDKALQTDRTLRDIATEFGIDHTVLFRYKRDTLIPSLRDEPICVQARADLVVIREKLSQESPDVLVPPDLADAAARARADVEPEMEAAVGEIVERAPFLPALYHEPVDPVAVLDEAVAIAARTMRGAERTGESYLAIAGAVAVGRLIERRVEWSAKWGVGGTDEEGVATEQFRQWLAEDPDTCVTCDSPLKDADGDWLTEATSEQEAEAFRYLAHLVLAVEEETDSE